MSDPVIVAITPADAWQKVATNVTAGFVWVKDSRAGYLQTYRVTGAAAPTLESEGVSLLAPGLPIEASSGIDVDVMATRHVGSVRVDL